MEGRAGAAGALPNAGRAPLYERHVLAGDIRCAEASGWNDPVPVEQSNADSAGTDGKRVGDVSDRLDEKLKSASGPSMPPDVESRVRKRVQAEIATGHSARISRRVSYGQILLLTVLLLVAGWVAIHNILPL